MTHSLSRATLCLFAVVAAGVAAPTAQAAIYMMFDGIDGESTEIGHENWSEILTTELSITVPSSTTGGTRTRATAVLSDLFWSQEMDATYPSLFSRITRGEITPSVDIEYTFTPRAGSREEVYFSMHFDSVALTKLDFFAQSGARARFDGAFNYEEIALTYFEFADGSKVGTHMASWRIETGESSANFAEVFALGLGAPPAAVTIPVPAAAWLLGSALIGLAGARRRGALIGA